MEITVCVHGDNVEIWSVGEEGGGYCFDGVGGFAEKAELVGVLLKVTLVVISISFFLVLFCKMGSGTVDDIRYTQRTISL